jgi:PLP dependent protein
MSGDKTKQMSVRANYEDVVARIAAAAERSGRRASDITLVAVTKTFPTDVILEVIEAGARHVGENRAQEFKQKRATLGERVLWHFIGHLQTNKVRMVVGAAHLIHSVDRVGVAEAIARRAVSLGVMQDVLIEVNISGEASKHGIQPQRAVAFAEEISNLEGLRLKGVMAMSTYPDDPEDSRSHYKQLASIGAAVNDVVVGATEVSMGMTRDFEVGVEEGATIVRIGEAIFGPRN